MTINKSYLAYSVIGIVVCTVGQVVHTLPEGTAVIGVTSLADEVYVLRHKESTIGQIEVYDAITFRLRCRLTVPNLGRANDMSSCEHYRCLYISDYFAACVHRLVIAGAATRWAVNDKPRSLSVNAAHNLIVICYEVSKIKEFSSHGDLLRELTLHRDVASPMQAVQTLSLIHI